VDEFIPTCVKDFVQKAVFVSVSPQRNKREVILAIQLLIAMVKYIINVKVMKAFE
jgi:hypothetical protein